MRGRKVEPMQTDMQQVPCWTKDLPQRPGWYKATAGWKEIFFVRVIETFRGDAERVLMERQGWGDAAELLPLTRYRWWWSESEVLPEAPHEGSKEK